jgi:hypothetical protein
MIGGMDVQETIVAGGGALPADSTGTPWNGKYTTASGSLLADFRANAAAEATPFTGSSGAPPSKSSKPTVSKATSARPPCSTKRTRTARSPSAARARPQAGSGPVPHLFAGAGRGGHGEGQGHLTPGRAGGSPPARLAFRRPGTGNPPTGKVEAGGVRDGRR